MYIKDDTLYANDGTKLYEYDAEHKILVQHCSTMWHTYWEQRYGKKENEEGEK